MYQLLIESMLGAQRAGNQLRLTPRHLKSWPTCEIHYRYGQTFYHTTITCCVADAVAANRLFLEGNELTGEKAPLVDDRREHCVELKISSPALTPEGRSALLTAV